MKEPEPRSEVIHKVDVAFLFDVDGVISDPKEKKVTNIGIIDDIVRRLESGKPIALNSGRSNSWMMERVFALIQERISSPSVLRNFIIIGEKGGTWIKFDETGTHIPGKREDLIIERELVERIKQLISAEYSSSMFFDDTKLTMISIEMKDGFDISEFSKLQQKFNAEVRQILEELGITNLKINSSVIATDIESLSVGKGLGAKIFCDFLRDNRISPEKFVTFGDTPTDLEMADELQQQGRDVEFVFFGDKEKLENVSRSFPILIVGNHSDGLHSYLLGLNS